MKYVLTKSPRSGKKWRILTPEGKKVDFGAVGYEDFTMHKDSYRKEKYISRHESREDWTKDGKNTAGFWSRWLLWNLPDFMDSVKNIESRFKIKIDVSSINLKSSSKSITNSDSNEKLKNPSDNLVNTPKKYDESVLKQYKLCKEETAKRKTLKLCPEGYCTVKLTEEVYPSYWANLKASKICTGELEDLEGNLKKHYERKNNKK